MTYVSFVTNINALFKACISKYLWGYLVVLCNEDGAVKHCVNLHRQSVTLFVYANQMPVASFARGAFTKS